MANITIQEVRQKYPGYDDLSDQELADKLHGKFYSDVPKEDFYGRIGLTADNQSQRNNNLEQFQSMIGANSTPLDIPRNLVEGAITGLGKGGQTIASALTGGTAPEVNMDEIFGFIGGKDKSTGSQIAKGIGEYLPYGAAGGASFLGQLGAGAGFGAATAEPRESNLFGVLPEGKVGGAIEGGLINALTHGAFKGAEALRPSKALRGTLPPEELQANLEATEGTSTGLGDVIGSPLLKRSYENIAPHLTFSGANKKMLQTAEQIKSKGQNILDEIGINKDSQEQNKILQDALKKASQEARKEKNISYENLNKEADKLGIKIGRENFSDKAKGLLAEVNESPELAREFDNKFLKDLYKYSNNKEGNNFKLSNIFKGKINDKANEFYQNGKMYEYGIAKDLVDSLEKDIFDSVKLSGNKDFKKTYEKVQSDYATKFKPFEDPDITKFTRHGGDIDLLLSHFLKTGPTNDRSTLLSKLTTKLQNKDQKLPLQLYLSKAIDENGQLNPTKLSTLYNKLGKNQKAVLINDKKLKYKLDNYNKLVKMNSEPLNIMFNPKTGQRNIDSTIRSLQGIVGYGLGDIPGAIAGIAVPGLASRPAVNWLTSPKSREKLVKAMIENKSWNKNITTGLQSAVQGSRKKKGSQ